MNTTLSIAFFEDYFVCAIMPTENQYTLLNIESVTEIPLYFMVNNNLITNNTEAKERYEKGIENTFGNFYQIIDNPDIKFEKYNQKYTADYLLEDIIPKIKQKFISEYQRITSTVLTSDTISFAITFPQTVSENAQQKIINQFKLKKFNLLYKTNNLEALTLALTHSTIFTPASNQIIIESLFNDLYFHYITPQLIDQKIKLNIKAQQIIKEKGTNHQITQLAELMISTVITQYFLPLSNTQKETEKNFLLKQAEKKINEFNYGELRTNITFSNGLEYFVLIKKEELDRATSASFNLIDYEFSKFIEQNNINTINIEKILIIGNALNNDIFIKLFSQRFGENNTIKPSNNNNSIITKGLLQKDNPITATNNKTSPITETNSIKADKINKGTKIEISWSGGTNKPNRVIIFHCTSPEKFEIIKHLNSSVVTADTFTFSEINKDKPALLKNVFRPSINKNLGDYNTGNPILYIKIINTTNN